MYGSTHTRLIPHYLAAMAGLLGCVVIAGWYTASPTIVQIHPNWSPMQYNTALCMLLSAAMLFARWMGRVILTKSLASLLITLPLATLVQYLWQLDLGIDQLFLQPFTDTQTSHPGRMAPNTALAFALIGITGWLQPDLRIQHLTITTLASLTLWMSLLALLGYLSNLTPAYGWGSMTAMAAHTAAGILAISAAILLHSFYQYKEGAPLEWQLACVAPMILIFLLALQSVPVRNDEIWQAEKTQADLALLEQHIVLKLNWLELMLGKSRSIKNPQDVPNTFQLRAVNNGYVFYHPGSDQEIKPDILKETLDRYTHTHHYSYQLSTTSGVLLLGDKEFLTNAFTGHIDMVLGDVTLSLRITPTTLISNDRLAATSHFVLVLSLAAVLGMFVILRNIRIRTQAEAQAAHLYAKFKRAIDTLDEGFAIITAGGAVTDKNNRLTIANVEHISDLLHNEDAEELRQVLNQPEPSAYTKKTINREGWPIVINIAPVPGTKDFVLLVADLRESIGQLKALEHQQAIISSAFDASTNGICVLDSQLNLIQVNNTLQGWLDQSQEQLTASTITHFIDEELHRDFIDALQRITTKPGITKEFEVKLRTGKKKFSWMQARAASQFSPSSKAILTTLNFMCIDQSKQLLMELGKTIEKLQRSNEELDQFAYVASHDLKSPLVGIKNISEWFDEDYRDLLPEEGKNHLSLIRSRCQSMMNLLDDLLQYSRAGRLEKKKEALNIGELTKDTLTLYDFKNKFQLHCPNINIELPRVPIETIFRNLISNTIKHHHKDSGNIFVDIITQTESVQIIYSDDGPGVPQQYYERILQPFTTLAPKDRTEGSGMGLAIITKVVSSLEGQLTLIEQPDRGLSVQIILPNTSG